MARDWQAISGRLVAFVQRLMSTKRGRRARLTASSIAQQAILYAQGRETADLTDAQLETLLRTRAKGELIDRIRREGRKRSMASASFAQELAKGRTVLSSIGSRERRATEGKLGKELLAGLTALLTSEERDLFLLRTVEDKPWSQIASQLGITEANARTRFTRVKRKMLRAHLEPLRHSLSGEQWTILELRGVGHRPWSNVGPLLELGLPEAQACYSDIVRPRAQEILGDLLGDMLAPD